MARPPFFSGGGARRGRVECGKAQVVAGWRLLKATVKAAGQGITVDEDKAYDFGRGKQHGTMRKTKHRGIASVGANFLLNLVAYNAFRQKRRKS